MSDIDIETLTLHNNLWYVVLTYLFALLLVTLDPIPPRQGSAVTSPPRQPSATGTPIKVTPPTTAKSPPGSVHASKPASAISVVAETPAEAPTPGTAPTITAKLTGPQKWSYVPNVTESTARYAHSINISLDLQIYSIFVWLYLPRTLKLLNLLYNSSFQ